MYVVKNVVRTQPEVKNIQPSPWKRAFFGTRSYCNTSFRETSSWENEQLTSGCWGGKQHCYCTVVIEVFAHTWSGDRDWSWTGLPANFFFDVLKDLEHGNRQCEACSFLLFLQMLWRVQTLDLACKRMPIRPYVHEPAWGKLLVGLHGAGSHLGTWLLWEQPHW